MIPATARHDYRPDIDGLRALAVLAVLFHHLNARLVPGGFVGVDVFFVISGYLITSQVQRDVRAGRFSLADFYRRRLNRIVPALVVVLAATLLAGLVLLSPADLARLAASTGSALAGVSNVYFWREYGNYFAGNSGEAPLLHTWSLGVEEQFYLLWPLGVALLLKAGARSRLALLVALIAAAVAVSEAATRLVASAAYYLLPSRFFELLLGGVLALGLAGRAPPPRLIATFAALLGLVLLAGSLWGLDKAAAFPGFNALWPCLGAGLLIWSGATGQPVAAALASRPMVGIGLLSYSLYLWHWPLIAFLHYTDTAINLAVGGLVVLTAFAAAFLSWRFVEVPLRRSGSGWPLRRVFLRRFLLPASLLGGVAALLIASDGLPWRFDPRVAEAERALAQRPEILRSGCHVPTARYQAPVDPQRCRLGSATAAVDGLLLGDSYANHFSGLVDVLAKDAGLAFVDHTMDGCPPLLGAASANGASYQSRCRARNEANFRLLEGGQYRRVILAADWPRDPASEDLLAGTFDRVRKAGAALMVIVNNESIARASSCDVRRLMYARSTDCKGPRRGPPPYLARLAERYPDVQFIDPNPVICSGKTCVPSLGGVLLYRDNGHLNDVGSRLLGEALLKQGVRLKAGRD